MSVPAKNAKKSCCVRGHPFAGSNLRVERNERTGWVKRVCRACEHRRGLRRIKHPLFIEFGKLWQDGHMGLREAYTRLGRAMGLSREQCQFSKFTAAQYNAAAPIVTAMLRAAKEAA